MTIQADFRTAVHEALQLWHKAPDLGSPLADLTLVQRELATSGTNLRRATNQVLLVALQALASDHAQAAAVLRARFLDGKLAFTVANELGVAEVTLFKKQQQAIGLLVDTLWAMEQRAVAARQAIVIKRLPPATYDAVVGIEAYIRLVSDVLLTPGAPWLVAVEGLGGIGKTTLAHQLVSRLASEGGTFADFGWVSAQQQILQPGGGIKTVAHPALTAHALIEGLVVQLLASDAAPMPVAAEHALAALETRLRQAPHLIVVDNLETLADIESLLPTLNRLANPSKFLLTSRETFHGPVAIYHFPVPELGESAALMLVRQEARLHGLAHVASADNDDLRPIFETVGGNPLALRLVTGQLHLLSLAQVVENLREARGRKAEDLYHYVYWNAWRGLPAEVQDTLLLMPLFAQDGADLTAIRRVSDLCDEDLLDALEYLVKLSLVSVGGDLHARRYSIHRLTESFLLKEVIKWRGEGGAA
ncbi:MAG: NB-ARC domain-containing protein [Chloroflexi bacterium]|nr:NB-ARC domain-containing protein [Chloroflexota bacterium]